MWYEAGHCPGFRLESHGAFMVPAAAFGTPDISTSTSVVSVAEWSHHRGSSWCKLCTAINVSKRPNHQCDSCGVKKILILVHRELFVSVRIGAAWNSRVDPPKLSCFLSNLMTVLGWCDRQVWRTAWKMKQDGDAVDSHVTKHQWGWQNQRPQSATVTSLRLIGRYRPSQLPDQKMEPGSII